VRIINDAALQAIRLLQKRPHVVLGLGTGLGSALVTDGVVEPTELAHLPYKRGRSFEEYVGEHGRERLGAKKWRRAVADVVREMSAALQVDEVVIGGGNARRLMHLPEKARRVTNSNGLHRRRAPVAGAGRLAKEHRGLLQRHPHAPSDRDPHRSPRKRHEPRVAARRRLDGDRVSLGFYRPLRALRGNCCCIIDFHIAIFCDGVDGPVA